VTQKWVGDLVVKVWYSNPCAGQWLGLVHCQVDSQSDCRSTAIAPKHKGNLAGDWEGAALMNTKNG
jgi:hypothetical protein